MSERESQKGGGVQDRGHGGEFFSTVGMEKVYDVSK